MHTTTAGATVLAVGMPRFQQVVLFTDCQPGFNANAENFCSICPSGTAGPNCAVILLLNIFYFCESYF